MTVVITEMSMAPGATSRLTPTSVEQAFKAADANNEGYLEQADLASAIVQPSPQGMKPSQEDAAAMSKEVFSRAPCLR